MPERVLNACPACARQYDVTHLASGEAVRCDCGERFPARRPSPEAVRAVKCSGCGGAVPLRAPSCPYCKAEISAEDRGIGQRCPHCLARGKSGDAFCGSCGGKLEPRARPAVPDGRACPRCEGPLRGENLGGVSLIECTACAGVWLTPTVFESVLSTTEAAAAGGPSATDAAPDATLYVEDEVRYLPCIGCGELMTRKRIGGPEGATVDLCRAHGLWFDTGELERILAWVRAGGKASTPWRPREEKRTANALAPPRTSLSRARDLEWWTESHRPRGLLEVLADLFLS